MASRIIQIEKWQGTDMAFVRFRNSDDSETNVIRCLAPDIFRDTPLPAEHRVRAGALVSLLLGYSRRTVLSVEIRWFEGVGVWVADALIDDGDQVVCRRGTAANPVEALVALSVDIQEY